MTESPPTAPTAFAEKLSIRIINIFGREVLRRLQRLEHTLQLAWASSLQSLLPLQTKNLEDRLSKMNAQVMGSNSDPFYGAPVVLIVLANKNYGTYVYDGSLVMGNLMLAAHELGIASCWIHRAKEEFESEEGKALLKNGALKVIMSESVTVF